MWLRIERECSLQASGWRVGAAHCLTTPRCVCAPGRLASPPACVQAWLSLPGSVRSGGNPTREEALQAVAVVNRVRRLLSETSGEHVQSTRVCVGSRAFIRGTCCAVL